MTEKTASKERSFPRQEFTELHEPQLQLLQAVKAAGDHV